MGIYCRLSFDPTGEETATARQEADCRALAEDNGWTVAAVYVDSDVSGYKRIQRPEWERMLRDVEAGAVQAVVVWKLDRLTRQPRDLERLLDVAEPRRVQIVSATEPFDLSNATGLYIARQFVSAANLYSAQSGERIARKHRQKAEAGEYAGGGVRPYGYERDGVTLNPGEAEMVREAVDRALAGEGIHGIAKDWNERGVQPVRAKRWDRATLRGLLTGPRIAGLRSHHGEVVSDAVWPAIVTRDEHERLKALLGEPSRRTSPGRARRHLLSGILVCVCETPMRGGWATRRSGEPRRIYRCPPASIARPGCGRVSITADPTDAWVVKGVLYRLSGPGLARALSSTAGPSQAVADRLAADEARLQALTRAHFVEGVVDRAGFMAGRSELAERIQAAKASLARQATAGILADLDPGRVREQWEAADLGWRRSLLAAVLDEVTVSPASHHRGFDPGRLVPRWRA